MPHGNNLVTPAPALVLFDIDGTLIRRAGPHHRQVLIDAVRHVTGLETSTDHIPVHGMLDPDILMRMMLDGGATRVQARRAMPAIIEKAQALYVRRCPDLTEKTCPGVHELLSSLNGSGIPVALVTGNLTRIGWRKMQRCGLKGYFRYGAFAEMARNRAELARLAIRHARGQRWIDTSAVVSLIGDAPSDIIAAKSNRARSIAVQTGISTREELLAEKPDLLIQDLSELRADMLVCKMHTSKMAH
jgi:phosphoglycolate phosphatase-like HAD superfamily hydrolase